jgi:hypothetical protein
MKIRISRFRYYTDSVVSSVDVQIDSPAVRLHAVEQLLPSSSHPRLDHALEDALQWLNYRAIGKHFL